jgi:hypothetical protein
MGTYGVRDSVSGRLVPSNMPIYAILVVALLVAGFFLFGELSLSTAFLICLFVVAIILVFYLHSSYTYEIGDDGLRIKSLIQSTLIPYQDIERVTSSLDVGFIPPVQHKNTLFDERAFRRRGLDGSETMVVIDTTKTENLPLLGKSITYIITPFDIAGFVAELKPKITKTGQNI